MQTDSGKQGFNKSNNTSTDENHSHNPDFIVAQHDLNTTEKQVNLSQSGVRDKNYISPKHLEEWRKSGVADEITSLAIQSLQNQQALGFLFQSDQIERRNTGRVSDRYLTTYRHTEQGGWLVKGINLLNPNELSEWGQFKPDFPRKNKEGKTIKYESPPKVATEVLALQVPDTSWQAMSNRLDVPISPQDTCFWSWVINHAQLPIVITEGAKKAGCGLSHGYITIALPGIFNGFRTLDKEAVVKVRALIPQLELFAQKGREIIFAFDQDAKAKTKQAVQLATFLTANLFKKAGCKVSIMSWSSEYKGLDDLAVACGSEALDKAFDERLKFMPWLAQNKSSLDKYDPLKLNQRYLKLPETIFDEFNFIGIKSPKNTGKTTDILAFLEKLLRLGVKVILPSHRRQLAMQLADRLGIDYIDDIYSSQTKGVLGYSLCVDSMHNEKFNPNNFEGCVVFIDEVEQVLNHAINSPTEVREHRVEILNNLAQLVRNAIEYEGKLILADADLSPISIDYFKSILNDIPYKLLVVENEFKPYEGVRKAIIYNQNTPIMMLETAIKIVENGGKIIVGTGGQKSDSTYGTKSLEGLFNKHFPDKKVLRVDAATIAEKDHLANGIIQDLDRLTNFDVVIHSPVIETGVSIDKKGHFTDVFIIGQGVQSPNSLLQTGERLRDDVTRHIWTARKGLNFIGNGSIFPSELLKTNASIVKSTITLLSKNSVQVEENELICSNNNTLKLWADFGVAHNLAMLNYREFVEAKLLEDGYEITHITDECEDKNNLKEVIKEVKKVNIAKDDEKLLKAPNYSEHEINLLKKKNNRTEDETAAIDAFYMKAYSGESQVTPELIEEHKKGLSKLQLAWLISLGETGKQIAAKKARSKIVPLKDKKQKVTQYDFIRQTNILPKVEVANIIELDRFLDVDTEWTNAKAREELIRLSQYKGLENLLGKGFSSWSLLNAANSKHPLRYLQKLLRDTFNIEFECIGRLGERGNRRRVYKRVDFTDFQNKIFANWKQQNVEFFTEAIDVETPAASSTLDFSQAIEHKVIFSIRDSLGNVIDKFKDFARALFKTANSVMLASLDGLINQTFSLEELGGLYLVST